MDFGCTCPVLWTDFGRSCASCVCANDKRSPFENGSQVRIVLICICE